ncbi:amidohydrolase [Parerythrobacter jejuensis]|uniref:Amidohydrolase family protein n=1 Tax=Parerythrobacter jejuensis TaxID=795812 RepID=A0A845ANL0_9SPHN|nr:amidohydrolase [Parerythrobacter jejuensis]MXP31049.1 amidohydrolase family protein [Parerythrobacter jejuensis]MXP33809.1 amidohydrolase family protein [Parerythrobacter jejuensis]
MRLRAFLICGGALALAACSATTGTAKETKSASSSVSGERADTGVPFPSTYERYPGVPTALVGATIFDGKGGRIENGTVLFTDGEVVGVGDASLPIPAGYTSIDGTGKFVTPGIIDIHSHLGDYPSPSVPAHGDGNEATAPTTPDVWTEHSVWPQDPGFSRALANGGITSLQILPGSANLMGGRAVTLKNVYSRTVQGMKFPGAPYGFKMACGENPKRVYGNRGRKPSTRMGNFAVNRQTWLDAQAYDGKKRDLGKETLKGVLDGEILVHNHCYRADEMALVMDMAKEMGYKVSAFHHAVEAYKIGDLLKANGVCSAIWADWYGFKMESYDGIPENAGLLQQEGACVVIHSDSDKEIQRLNQEAAKALAAGRRMGIEISDATAIGWITLNAAKAMGIDDMTGSLENGKMADVVLWNGNPLSVYSRPEKVWIDGALMYDALDRKRRPVSDFELGQPGEGDVK